MKSNKRVIDENREKLNYQTKQQELNGTIENLRLKKIKEEKLKESYANLKASKELQFAQPKSKVSFDDDERMKMDSILSKLPPELSITFEKMVGQVNVLLK